MNFEVTDLTTTSGIKKAGEPIGALPKVRWLPDQWFHCDRRIKGNQLPCRPKQYEISNQQRSDQRQEVVMDFQGAMLFKSDSKHVSSQLFFDDANSEFRVRDLVAFGESWPNFHFL